ncbi:MAG TPA: cell division protein FtsA [Dehalococcoidia bacterium]|nr:cell division protein FtsA [Dehalococcoidia bacterium]HCH08183.1 cell division protein FtsA [Dehalococcoidia bacterium]HIM17702.1 cell division protein FtsA [Dehalococcoidia bacterium]
MIQDSNIIMAIDVGTSKVCTIIARREGGRRFSVLSHSVVPSQGLQKGIVTDISATQSVIRESATKAARQARATVKEAYVGVTGSHVNFENRLDELDWAAKRGVITPADIRRVPTSVAAASAEPGRKVLHALPRNYILDGQSGIRNPLGMHTSQVKVETHVVTAAAMFIDKLNQAVRQAGVSVRELVLEPIASAEAVLTVEERESGVALVDIGGGTTDMVVYRQGTVLYNAALPIGGFQFTNDICLTYDTTYEAAEAVKLEHGTTDPASLGAIADVSLPLAGRVSNRTVALRDLSQLLRERAQELVRLIRIKLTESGYTEASEVRLVLTGGSASLPGLEDMIRRTITRHVRIGSPDDVPGIPDELRSPMFATSVGLLLWAIERQGAPGHVNHSNNHETEEQPNRGVSRFFKKMFPR